MRMRLVTTSLLRSAAVITVLVVLYYTVPLEQGPDPGSWIGFGFGLVFGLLVQTSMSPTREIRSTPLGSHA